MCIRDRYMGVVFSSFRMDKLPFPNRLGTTIGITDESSIDLEQERVTSKALCCLCVVPDKFSLSDGTTLIEETPWAQSTLIFNCCNFLQKRLKYTHSKGAVSIVQPTRYACLSGVYDDVFDGSGNQIGQVGLPFKQVCGKVKDNGGHALLSGALTALLAISCMRRPICFRYGSNSLNLICCCVTKCRTQQTLVILTSKEYAKFWIDAKYCQPGVICASLLPVEACRTVIFDIRDIEGQSVGTIKRYDHTPSYCLWCQANNKLIVNYPPNSSPDEKSLLFAAALSLFTLYYDCLLYTSDAADDLLCVDLGGRRIIKKKK
eukprot:TRINITY_DN1436_c0_g2_i3.p1 TRINITY_DN1436_c0_g2~~TRINITY_DN1436_c0_g2_i3.p1  ORF type:complete len:338 (-),score=10.36 TRINITY_DN1436_c0_g2_i3:19-972(-)